MPPDLTSHDVLEPQAPWGTMLRRGFRKHCPRCGGGNLYQGWFRMRERCGTCGFKFERENGFFVGAYLINFAIVEGILFVVLMTYVVMLDRNPDAGLVVPISIALVLAVVGPILTYPFSRTIWSAIDLSMAPIELDEIVAARDHLAALDADATEGSTPDGGRDDGYP